MGIIKRQGIKQSIVRYVGIAIGLVSTLFIYPLALEAVGLLRFIQNTAQLFYPLAIFGMHVVAVRFFPRFRDEETGHRGFLSLLGLITGLGFLIFLGVFFLFRSTLLGFFSDQPPEYLIYFNYIPALVALMLYSILITNYTSNFHRIVVPALFNELVIKIGLPALVLFFYLGMLPIGGLINGMLLAYALVLVLLLGYLYYLGQLRFTWHPQFLRTGILKELFGFSLYSVLGSWGYILANRLDVFMLGILLTGSSTFSGVAVYSINFFISEVIDAPRKALFNITGPIVADAWSRNDLDHIRELYQKSSLNQLLIGLLFFVGIWASLDDLFTLMPNGNEVAAGRWVVFFLGIGKIVDMAAGINGLIITQSRYFRFNFYAILLLAVTNVFTNLLLIPLYGLSGAALATLISVVLFNLIKLLYLYFKLGLWPWTWTTLWILLTGLLAYGVGWSLPDLGSSTLMTLSTILLRSLLILGVYMGITILAKHSPDVNELLYKGWETVRKFLGRKS
jgi:O-antigen/teichoic acid export membrane protein